MAIKIRKFRKLNEADEQQQQQNNQAQVPQNPNQQTQQQQHPQQQNQNQFNVNDFKNKVMNATDNVLKGTLENIARIMKEVPGVTQVDNNIPESKEMSQLYTELTQKKDYGTLGKFLSGLNNYAQAVVKRVEGGQNQNQNQTQQPQQQTQQQTQQPQQQNNQQQTQ